MKHRVNTVEVEAGAESRTIPIGRDSCNGDSTVTNGTLVFAVSRRGKPCHPSEARRVAVILVVIAGLMICLHGAGALRMASLGIAAEPQPSGEDPRELLVSGEVMDDEAILRRFTDSGGRLVESGKAVPMARLASQLGRRKCSLELPVKKSNLLGPVELAASCKRAVCVVGRMYKFGHPGAWRLVPASGFFVSRSGALLTSRHLINTNDFEAMVVLAGDGRVLPVTEVLASDPVNDVVIVQVGGTPVEAIPLENRVSAGTTIGVMSHPQGRFYTFTSGIVIRRSVNRMDGAPREIIEISADFGPGSSGAPVLNYQGNAVGWVDSLVVKNNGFHGEGAIAPQLVFRECGVAADALKLIEDQRGIVEANP